MTSHLTDQKAFWPACFIVHQAPLFPFDLLRLTYLLLFLSDTDCSFPGHIEKISSSSVPLEMSQEKPFTLIKGALVA